MQIQKVKINQLLTNSKLLRNDQLKNVKGGDGIIQDDLLGDRIIIDDLLGD